MSPAPARHARSSRATRRATRRRRRRALWCTAALLCATTALGGLSVYRKLDKNLATTDIGGALGPDRPPRHGAALNVLVLGSDTRAGANGAYGAHISGARSDTTMLLHVDGDREHATVLSIPRDTVVDRPACPLLHGGTAPEDKAAMFNTAFSVGGSACTVKTVERLGRVRVDHVVEVDFTGFKHLIDVIGGVTVTTDEDIHDPKSGLDLTAGTHRLQGERALALVRTRYGIGDGSDLGRIELQQRFVAALVGQLHAGRLLTDPVRLYRIADAATSALTTDADLGSLHALTSLAHDVSGIGPHAIGFRTLPVKPYPRDPNRVVADEPAAHALWQALRTDKPLPRGGAGR
ncbi:LCP family protein [Streptomyces sp. NPDC006422]|uniref:LCP family protein n=1 Tax=unclassified Streptomyces TaxID=2593676 RepID=UPI0033ACA9F8